MSSEGIGTDPEKVKSVREREPPTTLTELRSFLGLCSYYRKFVKDFSEIAKPLHDMTHKNARFHWDDECEEAFQRLKEELVSSPVLSMPKDDGAYILDTDASDYAIGGVLSQVQDGEER